MKDTRVRFETKTAFTIELRRRVDAYFTSHQRDRAGGPAMLVKTAILFAWLIASYVAMLLLGAGSGALAWVAVIGLGISCGLAMAGLGMAVQHDGGHLAYSSNRLLNRASASVLDLLGASSYVWRVKHAVVHHTYPNIEGVDDDLDAGPFARLSPSQPHRGYHRLQHLYMWPLYVLGVGKALVFYVMLGAACGVTLSVVFQLAHCVEEAEFIDPRMRPSEAGTLVLDFSAHQLATTIDFARDNKLLSWYVGGLNFQAEHHLFPRVCHLHYPALAEIVGATAAEYGVRYTATPTLKAALASHYRWLKRMGQGEAARTTRAEDELAEAA